MTNTVQAIEFQVGDVWQDEPGSDHEDAFKVTAVTPDHVTIRWNDGTERMYPVQWLVKSLDEWDMIKQAG